jgi:hypothetical protein
MMCASFTKVPSKNICHSASGEIRVLATERRIHLEEDRSIASLRGRLPVRDLNFDLGREGGTLLAPLER